MNSEKGLKNSKKKMIFIVAAPKSTNREKSWLPFSHLRTSVDRIFNSTWRNLIFVRKDFSKVFRKLIWLSFFRFWKIVFYFHDFVFSSCIFWNILCIHFLYIRNSLNHSTSLPRQWLGWLFTGGPKSNCAM